jgi:hypothetical protein
MSSPVADVDTLEHCTVMVTVSEVSLVVAPNITRNVHQWFDLISMYSVSIALVVKAIGPSTGTTDKPSAKRSCPAILSSFLMS